MKQINDKLYINEDNVQGVQKLGDKYILTTTNGNNLMITESIYNDLKEYEGGGGGGTSYSAGAGIDITDGTISNTYADVIANPVLAGTEADLTGIQVGDTKYVIPSGGSGSGTHLYKHIISIQQNENPATECGVEIISDKATQLTYAEIKSFLHDNGFYVDTNAPQLGKYYPQAFGTLYYGGTAYKYYGMTNYDNYISHVYGGLTNGSMIINLYNQPENSWNPPSYKIVDLGSAAVSPGKTLYQHNISYRDITNQILLNLAFIIDSQITSITDLKTWLNDKGYTSTSNLFYLTDGNYKGNTAYALYLDNTSIKIGYCQNGGYSITYANLNDSASISNREIGQANLIDGSVVIANPVLAGTERDLEGIEIDGTKYKVGGGKKLYKHNIYFTRAEDNLDGMLTITNDSPTKLESMSSIATVLYNKGFTATNKCIMCNAVQLYNSKLIVFNRAYSTNNATVTLLGRDSDGTNQYGAITVYQTITDTVEEL